MLINDRKHFFSSHVVVGIWNFTGMASTKAKLSLNRADVGCNTAREKERSDPCSHKLQLWKKGVLLGKCNKLDELSLNW